MNRSLATRISVTDVGEMRRAEGIFVEVLKNYLPVTALRTNPCLPIIPHVPGIQLKETWFIVQFSLKRHKLRAVREPLRGEGD